MNNHPKRADLRQDWRDVALAGREFNEVDFSKQDLSELDLRGCVFHRCNFENACLAFANAEGARFPFSRLCQTDCYNLNLRNGSLSWCDFEPSDAFGITLTMNCQTFAHMRIGKVWWLGLTYFFTQVREVADDREQPTLVEKLIGNVFGAQRYLHLRSIFQREV